MHGHTSDSKCLWSGINSWATCRRKPTTPGRFQDLSTVLVITAQTRIKRDYRYRLVQVRQNHKKKKWLLGWRPAIAFLYLSLPLSFSSSSYFRSFSKQKPFRSLEVLMPGTSDVIPAMSLSPEIFCPFSAVCLTVFLFEFRPATFNIGL